MPDNEIPKRPTEGKEDDFNNHWSKEFEEWWKPLLQTDGQWDPDKIKNEMHDLVFIYTQIDIIYSRITGGKLSKPMYYAGTIIAEFEHQIQRSYDEGYADGEKDNSSGA